MRVLRALFVIGLCLGIGYYSKTQEAPPDALQQAEKSEAEKIAVSAALATQPETPITEPIPPATDQPPFATVPEEAAERAPLLQEVPGDQPAAVPAQEPSPTPVPDVIPAPAQVPEPEVQPQVLPEVPVSAPEQPAAPITPPATPVSEEKEPEIIEIKGIDTLDSNEPKGNWLLKRIWWENAEQAYEKIKQMKQKVIDSRMTFFQKRTEFDRTVLDPFYIKIGVGQGELKEILSSLRTQFEQMRATKGSLNEQERAFLVALELEQETLNGLEQKLKAVTEVDNAIDDALLKLIEQINRAQEYENNAWEAFKTITRELSDKRARELYYSLEGNWKNIRAISEYIQKQYTPYFEQLLERAQTLVSEMDAAVQTLKEKGVDIKAQAQKISQQEQPQEEPEEVKPPKRSGWLSPLYAVWDAIVNVLSGIWNFITSFFVSKPAPKPVEVEAQVEEVVATDRVDNS